MQYFPLYHRTYFCHQSHSQLGVVLLWLSVFIPPGAISPLFSNSTLGTYQPGEFIFLCHIFLLFHSIHGVLKVRMLTWFAIPLLQWNSSGILVRILHHEPSVLGYPARHGSQFH